MPTKVNYPFLALVLFGLAIGCEQSQDPVAVKDQSAEEMLNPFLANKNANASGRTNPFTVDTEGGLLQGVGPVITPEGGFMVNNEYRFEEGQEFFVDVAIGNNRSLIFFLSQTNVVVAKGNGDDLRPDAVTEIFAHDGMVYVWGLRQEQEYTWTIAFRSGGINGLSMVEGHIGKPTVLTTTITSYLPQALLSNNSTATFEFVSNDPDATFECTLDDGTPTPCTSPMSYEGLSDGAHSFHVTAVDGARRDEIGDSHHWEVDLTAPDFTLLSVTPAETSLNISWSTSEDATTAVDWGLLAEAPENSVSESDTYTQQHSVLLDDLQLGAVYYFIIYGRDRAGNHYRSEVFSSVLSLTTEIIAYTPGADRTNTTTMTISFTSNDPSATFLCSLDGSTPTPCASPTTYTGLADGPHAFIVKAVNEWQQDPDGASLSWTVDTVPPFITFIATTTTTSTIQIDWTTNEPTTAYLEWGLNPVPENLIPESSDYKTNRSILLTGLRAASVYYFHIGGKDQAGNTYRSSRFSSATRR